jgi:hypothetical protein
MTTNSSSAKATQLMKVARSARSSASVTWVMSSGIWGCSMGRWYTGMRAAGWVPWLVRADADLEISG